MYDAAAFAAQLADALPTLLAKAFGVSGLYEITEGGTVETVALAECLFCYDGLEHLCTDHQFQFLLYFSHEASVTAGGGKLVELIHQAWPAYAAHFWHNPF